MFGGGVALWVMYAPGFDKKEKCMESKRRYLWGTLGRNDLNLDVTPFFSPTLCCVVGLCVPVYEFLLFEWLNLDGTS